MTQDKKKSLRQWTAGLATGVIGTLLAAIFFGYFTMGRSIAANEQKTNNNERMIIMGFEELKTKASKETVSEFMTQIKTFMVDYREDMKNLNNKIDNLKHK